MTIGACNGRVTPVTTLVIVAFCLLAGLSSEVAEIFMYKRQAVLDGQLWRVLSAQFVHFSASHLWYNIAVFLVAGVLVERMEGPRTVMILYGLTSLLSGVYLLMLRPEMHIYGGLSGVAVAAVIYASLCGMRAGGVAGRLYLAVGLLTAIKVVYEVLTHGGPVFVSYGGTGISLVVEVHLIGLLSGLALYLWSEWGPGRRVARGLGAQKGWFGYNKV